MPSLTREQMFEKLMW